MKYLSFLFVVVCLYNNISYSGNDEKTIKAKKSSSKISVDGFLNEADWQQTEPVNNFLQQDPVEGEPATEKTDVRILYDEDNLYFGCMMYDSEPDKIMAQLTRRDNEIISDVISIRMDTYHDHKTCFEFTILASGTKVDILQYNDAENEDKSWDAVWDVKTRITENGWIAEVRIPFKVLRFSNKSDSKTWGINFIRRIPRKNESDYWVLIKKAQSGFISRFGHLTGLDSIHSPTRLEILPYIVTSERMRPNTEENNNIQKNTFNYNAGLDIKYGISSNATLDLTLNPDFGQVEADPEVLNLSTFETFYPEKRPFFIEGTQILKFSGFGGDDGLFYSRRIGKAPSGGIEVPLNGYLKDYPDYTTILGAAKVTGKNESGLSFGIMEALTNNEYATLLDAYGNSSKQKVEPLANYSVIRVKQDLFDNSTVGGILTSTIKDQRFPALTGGLDWKFKFFESIYSIDGFFATSKTSRNNERISGSAGRLTFAKTGGEHWLYSLSTDFTEKDYYINDLGFFRRPNDHGGNASLMYKDQVPNSITREWMINTGYHLRWNFDRANLYRDFNLSGGIIFLNYYIFETEYQYSFGDYDDRETRGNGLYKRPKSYSITTRLVSDETKPYVMILAYAYNQDERKATGISFAPEFQLKPRSNIEINLGFGYASRRNVEAFIENMYPSWSNDTRNVLTIFGDRNTDEYNFVFNGSWTFTQNFTLQMYSQIFMAKGHYSNFRYLASPEKFYPLPLYIGIGNPEFNESTFQLNTVLRYEYLPGSIIYLVWTQSRGNFNKMYNLGFMDNLNNTFRVPSDNTVMLKVSYWMDI